MKKIMVILACALLGTSGVVSFAGCERTTPSSDEEARKQYASLIASVQVGGRLIAAQRAIRRESTSLAREKPCDEYYDLVKSLKGQRVALCGVIKNVGTRIWGNGLYISLIVDGDFDVKFVFTKDALPLLKSLKTGARLWMEGNVVSTGDLLHQLTVDSPIFLSEHDFKEAVRLGAAKD